MGSVRASRMAGKGLDGGKATLGLPTRPPDERGPSEQIKALGLAHGLDESDNLFGPGKAPAELLCQEPRRLALFYRAPGGFGPLPLGAPRGSSGSTGPPCTVSGSRPTNVIRRASCCCARKTDGGSP